MSKYEPAIGQIDFNFTALESLQNVDLAADPGSKIPTLELISPLTLAQYALYNTEKEEDNFGLDDNLYLVYEGGFITQGNKINNKRGSFFLRGNLTVRQNTNFYKSIDLKNNSIRNVKSKGTSFVADVLKANLADNEPITAGDFRNYAFAKGTIMMWSGTYDSLVFDLPNWRLCGRPDSNVDEENGVTIPNLEGFFIIGAGYSNNLYTSKDNFNENFSNTITLSTGVSGGFNGVFINLNQMPLHKHGVNFSLQGGQTSLLANGVSVTQRDLYLGGGELSFAYGTVAWRCWSGGGCQNAGGCTRGRCGCATACACTNTGISYYSQVASIGNQTSTTTPGYNTITLSDPALIASVTNQLNVGSDQSHENRPPFYVLGYIINVGKRR